MTYRYNHATHRWDVHGTDWRLVASFPDYEQAREYMRLVQRQEDMLLLVCRKLTWGIKVNSRALWIGAHWSPYNKRLCINVIPCVTLWIVWPGGNRP